MPSAGSWRPRTCSVNNLDARAGDVHASPELQLLAETLDLASARFAEALEAERRGSGSGVIW